MDDGYITLSPAAVAAHGLCKTHTYSCSNSDGGSQPDCQSAVVCVGLLLRNKLLLPLLKEIMEKKAAQSMKKKNGSQFQSKGTFYITSISISISISLKRIKTGGKKVML